MGGTKLVTYTLATESGASLRGAGWRCIGEIRIRKWDMPNRERRWQPVYGQQKLRWEVCSDDRARPLNLAKNVSI